MEGHRINFYCKQLKLLLFIPITRPARKDKIALTIIMIEQNLLLKKNTETRKKMKFSNIRRLIE